MRIQKHPLDGQESRTYLTPSIPQANIDEGDQTQGNNCHKSWFNHNYNHSLPWDNWEPYHRSWISHMKRRCTSTQNAAALNSVNRLVFKQS